MIQIELNLFPQFLGSTTRWIPTSSPVSHLLILQNDKDVATTIAAITVQEKEVEEVGVRPQDFLADSVWASTER